MKEVYENLIFGIVSSAKIIETNFVKLSRPSTFLPATIGVRRVQAASTIIMLRASFFALSSSQFITQSVENVRSHATPFVARFLGTSAAKFS